MKTRIVVATPFRGSTEEEFIENIHYARLCMLDSLNRGEAPFMSHLLYPLRTFGVLDEDRPDQRQRGFDAEKQWLRKAEMLVLYRDKGLSDGMSQTMELATQIQIQVKFRRLSTSEFAPDSGDLKKQTPLIQ